MRHLLLLSVFIPLYSSITYSDLQRKEILLSSEVKPQFICSFGLDNFLIVPQNSDTIMKVNKDGIISERFKNMSGGITNIVANRTNEYLAFISNNQLTLYNTSENETLGFIPFFNNITSLQRLDNIIIALKKNSVSHVLHFYDSLKNICLEIDITPNHIPRVISCGLDIPHSEVPQEIAALTTKIMEKIILLSSKIPITLNNYIKAHFSPFNDLIALTTDIATSYNIYSLPTKKSYKITSINQEEIKTIKCLQFNPVGDLAILYLAHEKPDPLVAPKYSNLALKLMIQRNFDQTRLTQKNFISYPDTGILSTFDIEYTHDYSCDNIHTIEKKAHLCDNYAIEASCSRIAILSPTKITVIPIDK